MTRFAMARVEDVVDFAAGLNSDHLACRDWAHGWDSRSQTVKRVAGRLHQVVECGGCGTLRVRVIDPYTGTIVGNRYIYPEGYQAKGLGRIGRAGLGMLRLESLRRDGVL